MASRDPGCGTLTGWPGSVLDHRWRRAENALEGPRDLFIPVVGCMLVDERSLSVAAGHIHIHIKDTQYVAGRTKATDPPGATAITTNQGRPCSTVEQIGLGVDLGLPLIKTNVRTRCDLDSTTTGQRITALSWALQLVSWAAATLVIAGYTGVVRRT